MEIARKAGLLALILAGLAFVTPMISGRVRGTSGEEESPEKIIEKEDVQGYSHKKQLGTGIKTDL